MALTDEQSIGVRPRTMTTGDGGKAKIWIDDSGHRVVMRTEIWSPSGGSPSGGVSYWERCAIGGCVGSATFDGGHCFSHAGDAERKAHLQDVTSGTKPFNLCGNGITNDRSSANAGPGWSRGRPPATTITCLTRPCTSSWRPRRTCPAASSAGSQQGEAAAGPPGGEKKAERG
jgi:hypothetical protein